MKWLNPLNGEKDPMNWDAGWMQYQLAKKPFDLVQNVLLTIKNLFHHETEASLAPLKKMKFLANGPVDIPSLCHLIEEPVIEENIYEIEYIKLKKDKKDKKDKSNKDQPAVLEIVENTEELTSPTLDKNNITPEDFTEVDQLEEAIHDSVLEIETIQLDEQKEESKIVLETIQAEAIAEEKILEIEALDIETEDTSPQAKDESKIEKAPAEIAEPPKQSFTINTNKASAFTSWINQFSANNDPDFNERKLKSNVDLSVHHSEDIISESLAKILAKQGHTKESIEMYRKLSLKFPEKSGYFASLINEINKH